MTTFQSIYYHVLILILMEDTLWECSLARSRDLGFDLNPYSNGRYSMREVQQKLQKRLQVVLILINPYSIGRYSTRWQKLGSPSSSVNLNPFSNGRYFTSGKTQDR